MAVCQPTMSCGVKKDVTYKSIAKQPPAGRPQIEARRNGFDLERRSKRAERMAFLQKILEQSGLDNSLLRLGKVVHYCLTNIIDGGILRVRLLSSSLPINFIKFLISLANCVAFR